MRYRQRLLYLLVDGASARFVEWSQDKRDFVTVRRMSGEGHLRALRAEQRDTPAGRSFESASVGRHAVGRESVYRRAKEVFALDVARGVADHLAGRDFDGVVLAAPSRLLKVVRASLPARTNIVAEVGKDLLKVPDHDLGAWLDPLPLAAVC